MSVWTHISGIIRGDYIKEKDVMEVLGKPMLWNDIDNIEYNSPEYEAYLEEWENRFTQTKDYKHLPMGSEGSLNWKIVNMQVDNGCWFNCGEFVIAFWGDLRDYEDLKYVKKWFLRVCKDLDKKGMCIRNACLNAYVEFGKSILIEYKEQGK